MRPSGQQPRERDNLLSVWQVPVNTFSVSAGDQDTRQPRTQRGSARDRSEIAPWLWSSSERDWGHEMVQTVLSTRSSRVSLQPGCGSPQWGPNWLGGRPQYSENETWFTFKSYHKWKESNFLTHDIEVGVEAGEEEELLRHAVRHGVSGADLVLERLCAGGQCIGDEEYRDYWHRQSALYCVWFIQFNFTFEFPLTERTDRRAGRAMCHFFWR